MDFEMSDNVDWIVVLDARLDEADALANRVKDWLIAEEIILPRTASKRSLNGGEMWLRGWAAKWDDDLTFQSRPALSGLEIAKERQVFHAGGHGIDSLTCPHCGAQHRPDNLEWSDAVGSWQLGNDGSSLFCTSCHVHSPIVDWEFCVPWALGSLGFGFWNWVVRPELVDQIASLTGYRCRLVREHI